jgi:ADP-ribose pyrophosphatase YjhB (NUDIX family)
VSPHPVIATKEAGSSENNRPNGEAKYAPPGGWIEETETGQEAEGDGKD